MADNALITKAIARSAGRVYAQSYTYVQKYWKGGDDPLKFLLGWEQEAAHLHMQMAAQPELRNARGSVNHNVFAQAVNDTMPVKKTMRTIRRLFHNPAWLAYLQYLKVHARDEALDRLKATSAKAVDTYLWAQDKAKSVGDYKEARVAAGDHLDRIGATEKPQPVTQVAVVTLRGRNFTAEDLDKASPEVIIEAEKVD